MIVLPDNAAAQAFFTLLDAMADKYGFPREPSNEEAAGSAPTASEDRA